MIFCWTNVAIKKESNFSFIHPLLPNDCRLKKDKRKQHNNPWSRRQLFCLASFTVCCLQLSSGGTTTRWIADCSRESIFLEFSLPSRIHCFDISFLCLFSSSFFRQQMKMLSKKGPITMTKRMLTTVSAKEVSEALKHVQESEKKVKVPILDRSRVLLLT